MKKSKLLLNLFACVMIASQALAIGSTHIKDYKIITEDYAPFNYHKNSKIVGFSVEMLREILSKMGEAKKINDLVIEPWNKAFNEVQVKENTMVFSTARTRERENLFKWVGPIFASKYVLFAKKNSGIKISSLKDLKHYKIGVMRDDQAEAKLRSIGITNKHISASEDISKNLKKLLTNRIDLLAIQDNSLKLEMEKIEENYDELEVVFELDRRDLFFAFNSHTPDELIKRFASAFDEVKNSKFYTQTLTKYIKN